MGQKLIHYLLAHPTALSTLSQHELTRYHRQLLIPEFGREGQKRLKKSHVIIIGIGGLGCASATYLAAAGIGQITLVDFDVVELSDLNRQVLYWEEDIGGEKVFIAQQKLSKLNPAIKIIPVFTEVTEENVSNMIKENEVVVDGLDNLVTRHIVNSACVNHKIPYIYGGVSRLRGMMTTIIPGKTPCLACVYPEKSQEEGKLGVLGVIPALIANFQSLETIKLLIGQPPSFAGKLLRFNGNDLKFRIDEIKKNEACKICSSASLLYHQ
jgi:molybdopterin/thiamine biosynthesis adenylyltransferase